jgi:hypothetical protein
MPINTDNKDSREVIPVYLSKYKEKIRKLKRELIKLGTSYSELIK